MGLSLLRVCCESINFIDVNHTNRIGGFFYDGSIEWDEPIHRREKLVSHGFHM